MAVATFLVLIVVLGALGVAMGQAEVLVLLGLSAAAAFAPWAALRGTASGDR